MVALATTSDTGIASPQGQRARKFVIAVDDSVEAWKAARFAAGRAAKIDGGELVLFYAIEPSAFEHWMAVADRMRKEAMVEAQQMLAEKAALLRDYSGLDAQIVIREGKPADMLKAFLEEEDDLFALILGAGAEGEPGPLISHFSGPLAGCLSCPVVIVPGGMSEEQIDALV